MSESDRAELNDVRMRGFGTLTPVSEAIKRIDLQTTSLGSELVPLDACSNRVIASDIVSPVNIPSFARSAMDGYAVAGGNAFDRLHIIGDSKPGCPYEGSLLIGEAVRIMTGAPVPSGAVAVVPVEKCRLHSDEVELLENVIPGKHIALPGEDVRQGNVVLQKHRVLRPQDVGLLSSIGFATIEVVKRPRVAIVTSGAELLPPGTPPSGYQIADSNTVMLQALAERDGAVVVSKLHITEEPQLLRTMLRQTDWDILLVNGGTSVGSEDYAPVVLRAFAAEMVHGIAMKPGMPSGFGVLPDGRMVFLLPGNPIACLFAYEMLARRNLRRLAERANRSAYPSQKLHLSSAVSSKLGRTDFVRVKIDLNSGEAQPLPMAGASNLSGIVNADGFIVVDESTEQLTPGEMIEVFQFDQSR